MVNNERVTIFNTDAKVYLDYEVSILREILDSIRNEAGSSSTSVLREYEHKLIETKRLDEIREATRQQEFINRKIEGDVE